MSRYLNLSELAHVRWLASETMRRRRPRRAGRVRAYAAKPRALSGSRSPRPPRPPLVPSPGGRWTPLPWTSCTLCWPGCTGWGCPSDVGHAHL